MPGNYAFQLWLRTKIIQKANPKAGELGVVEKNKSKSTLPHMFWSPVEGPAYALGFSVQILFLYWLAV